MLPFTAGARPGKINMIFLPNSANSRLLPERKPSPTPTRSSKDPTPQAIPNMVRNERSLCAHRLRKICAKMSKTVRIIETHCTSPWVRGSLQSLIGEQIGGCIYRAERNRNTRIAFRYRGPSCKWDDESEAL